MKSKKGRNNKDTTNIRNNNTNANTNNTSINAGIYKNRNGCEGANNINSKIDEEIMHKWIG